MPQTTTTMIAAQMSHTGMATQNGRYMLVLRLSRTLTPGGQDALTAADSQSARSPACR
jgi:hypothetical protein